MSAPEGDAEKGGKKKGWGGKDGDGKGGILSLVSMIVNCVAVVAVLISTIIVINRIASIKEIDNFWLNIIRIVRKKLFCHKDYDLQLVHAIMCSFGCVLLVAAMILDNIIYDVILTLVGTLLIPSGILFQIWFNHHEIKCDNPHAYIGYFSMYLAFIKFVLVFILRCEVECCRFYRIITDVFRCLTLIFLLCTFCVSVDTAWFKTVVKESEKQSLYVFLPFAMLCCAVIGVLKVVNDFC